MRVVALTIPVGDTRQLSIAQGEDREYRLTFTQAGTPIDLSATTDCRLRIVNPATGQPILDRDHLDIFGPGTPRFQILQADIAGLPAMQCGCDVMWQDTSGVKTQLLAFSSFVLEAGAP